MNRDEISGRYIPTETTFDEIINNPLNYIYTGEVFEESCGLKRLCELHEKMDKIVTKIQFDHLFGNTAPRQN